jgi:hypothetical protein
LPAALLAATLTGLRLLLTWLLLTGVLAGLLIALLAALTGLILGVLVHVFPRVVVVRRNRSTAATMARSCSAVHVFRALRFLTSPLGSDTR